MTALLGRSRGHRHTELCARPRWNKDRRALRLGCEPIRHSKQQHVRLYDDQECVPEGTSGSGSINIGVGGLAGQCKACPFTSTAWSRCEYTVVVGTTQANFFVGPEPTTGCGAVGDASGDVLVWGLQSEVNPVATSYIPTTTVSATRGVTTPSIDISGLTPRMTTSLPSSYGVTVKHLKLGTTCVGFSYLGTSTAFPNGIGSSIADCFGTSIYAYTGAGAVGFGLNGGSGIAVGNTSRLSISYDPVEPRLRAYINRTQVVTQTGSITAGANWTPLSFGPLNGIYSDLCLDPNPARCR